MFDFVLCLRPFPAQPSAEFAEGLQRLRAQLGGKARWLWSGADAAGGTESTASCAEPLEQLLRLALDAPEPASTVGEASGWLTAASEAADTRTVLLLAHAHVLLADTCLPWLREALTGAHVDAGVAGQADGEAGATAFSSAGAPACELSLCWTAAHAPADLPPHYATVRGLERYAHALRAAIPAQDVPLPQPALPAGALVGATTVGALARWLQGQTLAGAWWPGCFAHDFSSYHQGHEGRRDMLAWVPQEAQRVLDVGGGEGHFLALLRAERGCETHLSEFSPSACARAVQRVDHAWPGDFLRLHVPDLPDGGRAAFDCITFLDSLEHAAEPGQWLDQAHSLLRPEGSVVGSVPHVGHWTVLADLLEGRWDYCPVGIHCNTHLRFFTQRTLTDLLARHGFELEHLETTTVPCPPEWRSHWLATPALDTRSAQLDAYAFTFRARKAQALTKNAGAPQVRDSAPRREPASS